MLLSLSHSSGSLFEKFQSLQKSSREFLFTSPPPPPAFPLRNQCLGLVHVDEWAGSSPQTYVLTHSPFLLTPPLLPTQGVCISYHTSLLMLQLTFTSVDLKWTHGAYFRNWKLNIAFFGLGCIVSFHWSHGIRLPEIVKYVAANNTARMAVNVKYMLQDYKIFSCCIWVYTWIGHFWRRNPQVSWWSKFRWSLFDQLLSCMDFFLFLCVVSKLREESWIM